MKLNIASGGNVFPDWVNLDRTDVEEQYLRHLRNLTPDQVATWPDGQRALVQWLAEGRVEFKQKDLREGFAEYADGSIEAVYLGQIVEHLHPHRELPQLLAECCRMLKPGGRVRITTPDLDLLVKAYAENKLQRFESEQPDFYRTAHPADQLSYLMFGASGPESTRESYDGHMHLYTPRTLSVRLIESGFQAYGVAPSTVFAECTDFGLSHSIAIEAVKK